MVSSCGRYFSNNYLVKDLKEFIIHDNLSLVHNVIFYFKTNAFILNSILIYKK